MTPEQIRRDCIDIERDIYSLKQRLRDIREQCPHNSVDKFLSTDYSDGHSWTTVVCRICGDAWEEDNE